VRLSEQVVAAMRWDTVATLATSVITFVTSVWIVRVLGPERFAVLAVVLATLSLLQLMTSAGFRPALLRFVPEAVSAGVVAPLLVTTVVIRTGALAVVSLPLLLAAETVAEVIGRADVAPYLATLPVLLALTMIVDVLGASLVALFRQRVVRSAEVANKLVFAACLATVPGWNDPVIGVLAASMMGSIVAGACLVIDAARRGLLAGCGGWRTSAQARWLAFSGASYALGLIGFVLGRELDVLLLTRLGVGSEEIARYTVIFAFVGTLLAAPLLPIAGGFDIPLIARLHARGDVAALRRLFEAFFEYVYIFVLPIVGVGIVLGPTLVGLLYGPPYGHTGLLLATILVALGLAKLGGVTAPFLLATDRERTLLRIRVVMAGMNIALALLLIPRFGVAGAATATGVALLASTAWEAWLVHTFLAPRYPWAFLARVVVATAVAMAVTSAGMFAWPAPRWIGAVALAVLGGSTYVLMLLWLKPVSRAQGRLLTGGRAPALASVVGWFERPEPTVAGGREA
jgi:O-antigen/teichoic acid export membrane protein